VTLESLYVESLWRLGGINLEKVSQGGKVGVVAESSMFDGFELGKGLAELSPSWRGLLYLMEI
jgi:hypothetical protein